MHKTSSQSNKAFDLVCGMEVELSTPYMVEHKGETYYFCSQSCKDHFVNDPKRYLAKP